MPVRFSIITTCKGRLRDLQRSMPQFLKQGDSEVIVVDGTGAYVAQTWPGIRVVAVKDQPGFNISDARNRGAAIASGELLVFLDADVILADNAAVLIELVGPAYGLFSYPVNNSLRGSCIVRRSDFVRVGGYDELIDGYGGEDLELYSRLRLIGLSKVMLAPGIVSEVIDQAIEDKERFRGPDLKRQFLRGQLYTSIKEMLVRELGNPVLDMDLRQRLMNQVDERIDAVYSGEAEFVLEVELPDRYRRGFLREWEFTRKITVRAKKAR
jgi:glycosyltransferase involved in cell wall biosynthesis